MYKSKIKNDNEYGSARFAKFNEIKDKFSKECITSINEVGFPIWYSKDNKYVWFDKETPHYVYLGSTGSGKSVTCVIPTCSFIATAKKKRSVFITDPKGEIYHTTSKMFKNNGYDIFVIDFRIPELSNKINLLEPIILEYEKYIEFDDKAKKIEKDNGNSDEILFNRNNAMRHLAECNHLITSISSLIMKEKTEEKDPFWNNSSKNLLEGLIALFLEEYRNKKINREQITLTSIKKFQSSTMNEENFEEFVSYIDSKTYGMKSKDSLTSVITSSENTYKSITATFGEKMSLFDDVNVANITSSTDFDFDVLGKKPTAIYIIVPDEDKTYYKLITIVVGLLYKELVKLANSNNEKRLPVEIDWILDEFANCPPLDDIEAIVSVARSRGMRFHFFVQSFSQLDSVYGKEISQIILDNCGLVYLKTNTQETAEAISKRLGKTTIESRSISQSISKLDLSGNQSISLMGRDLLTPEEVKQLHYKTIIFPVNGYPILRNTVLYNKFSCYESGEVIRNPISLKDLSYTYFTIENLKDNDKDDVSEFYDDYKKSFEPILEKVKKILKNQKYEIDYPINNYNMYCSINVENILNSDDEIKIRNLNDELFYIEVINEKEKYMVNIYKKI